MENIQELAADIDRFLYDADFYRYVDDQTSYEKILDCITSDGASGMLDELNEFVENDNDETAKALVQKLSGLISKRG